MAEIAGSSPRTVDGTIGLPNAAPVAWQSRHIFVTPEQLGLRSVSECRVRVEQLGLTPLPKVAHRQEHWRLDALLIWSRSNGLGCLPRLGLGLPYRRT